MTKITIQSLIDNAWKALDEERLEFFKPDLPSDEMFYCHYQQDGYCCAVGASIGSDDYATSMECRRAPDVLMDYFDIRDVEVLKFAQNLQSLHDDITREVAYGIITTAQASHKFRNYLHAYNQ